MAAPQLGLAGAQPQHHARLVDPEHLQIAGVQRHDLPLGVEHREGAAVGQEQALHDRAAAGPGDVLGEGLGARPTGRQVGTLPVWQLHAAASSALSHDCSSPASPECCDSCQYLAGTRLGCNRSVSDPERGA